MPQLDKFIIISNIFWLFIYFSIILFFLSTQYLPLILKSIRIRHLKLKNFYYNISHNLYEGILIFKLLFFTFNFYFLKLKIKNNNFLILFKNWIQNFKYIFKKK